jgi:hypothetical protein
MFLVGWTTTSALAQSTSQEALQLGVGIYNAAQQSTFSAIADSQPYYFNATLRVASEGFWLPCNDVASCPPPSPLKGDLYFGVITPNGVAFSWVLDGDGDEVNPRQGMIPVATNLDLSKALLVDVTKEVGEMLHAFTPNSPLGMYSIFALLVKAENDPRNPSNWLEAEMRPLIVTPYAGPLIDVIIEEPAGPLPHPDAIVKFTPHKNISMAAGEEPIVLEGTIESIEGAVVDVIILPANVFTGGLTAGIPVTLYLMKFLDQEAYYPIYQQPFN